jgi:transposase
MLAVPVRVSPSILDAVELARSLVRGLGGPQSAASSAYPRFLLCVSLPGGRVPEPVEVVMKRIRDRVGGLDVHRDSVMACARTVDADGVVVEELERFSTTVAGVAGLARWLLDRGLTTVGMEATGEYWKPVYYGLEGLFDELWLCNAHHVKNVPGRKTDACDAAWLADVLSHGMVKPSLVPPAPVRALRDETRYRKTLRTLRGQEIQRLEKVLQDACVKLTSVTSGIWSKSSRAMVEALIAGERDPLVLADLAKGRMRSKTAELVEALASNWKPHHSFVAGQIINHIDYLDASIDQLSEEIEARIIPFADIIGRLVEVPGISRTTAETIVAETGADMTRFATAGHLCAWAGVAPANHESAGRRRPDGTRHGQRHLRQVLIEAGRAAAMTRNTYFAAQYRRIARRRGSNKAAVAVAHSLLVVAWHLMAHPDQHYQDLGADFFTRRIDPERQANKLVKQLAELGYHATLQRVA